MQVWHSTGYGIMKINSWYNNGSMDAFYHFCTQNRCKTIWLKLKDKSEFVKGVLYKYNTANAHLDGDGLYIFLNLSVIHPAYFCLDDIESIHVMP